jgi:hypothetical protein
VALSLGSLYQVARGQHIDVFNFEKENTVWKFADRTIYLKEGNSVTGLYVSSLNIYGCRISFLREYNPAKAGYVGIRAYRC